MQIFLIILLILVGALLVFFILTVFVGFHFVPQKYEYSISKFGKYYQTWKAGLHWKFPWFGFIKIDAKVFMGEQALELSLGKAGASGGVVDFRDESAPVEGYLYMRIFDSKAATYDVDDVLLRSEETADAALRSFLAQYDVEEANEIKSDFNLPLIASAVKLVKDANGQIIPPVVPPLNTTHFSQVLDRWGVEPLAFVLTDIDLPARIIEQRRRQLEAAMNVEVSAQDVKKAKNEAKTALIKAEAARKAEVLRATGEASGMDKISAAMAKRIKDLVAEGMKVDAAAIYVKELAKTEALKNAKQVIWTEGSSMAASGAAFGAGFNSNTPNP